ncbi:MAG TPA: hypothetical protein VMJ34_04725 [Bryobacteraceae bacterium]|nr:hypothetical protein [Bryobacteraceae bacterium]
MTKQIAVDEYVIAVLMRDLVGHDRMPSAFLVYLYLWGATELPAKPAIRASHRHIAEETGLSKSAVQKAIRCLIGRKLLRVHRESPTATPEYRVLRTWRR